jgi:glutamate dehydrogenase (NAD(P)+)
MKTSIDPNHPFFSMALKQLNRTASVLGLKDADVERLKWPRRSITVSIPVRMDNGEVKTFYGYRVLHYLSNGPSKGGLRFHLKVDLGEMSALSMFNSWKYALYGLPFGGAKGGVACDPSKMSSAEIERLSRRYAQEMIAYIGPEMDVMDPDLGTNEQIMAWIMDVYSINKGYTVPSVVTGKPL